MASASKIPVVVLTGFLGGGKTSLLNAALRHPDFSDSAVVVNEFGEIGLDHLLVSEGQENILLLDAGCLCCTVLGSLKETLADLFHRRARAETPPFQRVLIETTGLADPAPILQTLMRDPLITPFFAFQGLACVVDGVFGLDSLGDSAEASAQAAMADRLIVSKTDLTGGVCAPALADRLRALNPIAPIALSTPTMRDPQRLLGFEGGTAWGDDAPPPARRWQVQHEAGVQSLSYRLTQPVTWAGVAAWSEVMRRRYGRDLLRCKGLLNVTGLAGPVVLHGVRTLFDTRREAAWPDDERRSRLVVIGRGLDSQFVKTSLAWLHAPEGAHPPANDQETMAGPPAQSAS